MERVFDQRIWVITSLVLLAIPFLFSTPNANAATISWTTASQTIDTGGIGLGNNTVTVNDPLANTNPLAKDSVQIQVKSTTYPQGINLTLYETGINTGIFKNNDLIYTNGTNTFSTSSKQTISVKDTNLSPPASPTIIDKIISGPDNANDGIQVLSSMDSSTGIYLNMTETGVNTNIYSNILLFTTGSSVNGSSIKVKPGSIVTIFDLDQSLSNTSTTNELVTPNPDPATGALPAKFGDTITATYNGATTITATASISSGSGSGGGGGGLIRPSLVLDVIAGTIGGSPFVVSPPSFGGSFSDGLTLTQGSTKTTFDTSKFNQEIPKQVLEKGVPDTMSFKTFEAYNKDGVIGMTLYFVPRGKDLDMDVQNSIASIEWKNGKPVDVDDSNHILSDVKATSNDDGNFQHTQFSFTPTKSYDKMSFLVRAWNDHHYTKTMRVHDAVDVVQPPKTLPPGVVKYENFADLQDVLYRDKFYKPEILAHIHDRNAVFPELQGKVYWLYDTNEHSVTLVISDSEDNELFAHKGLLQPYEIVKKPDYGFMTFTTVQLNRQNVDQIQQVLEAEEEKAKNTLLDMKIIRTSKW